jgi:hypothetical protein
MEHLSATTSRARGSRFSCSTVARACPINMDSLGAETAGWHTINYQQRGLAPSTTDGPFPHHQFAFPLPINPNDVQVPKPGAPPIRTETPSYAHALALSSPSRLGRAGAAGVDEGPRSRTIDSNRAFSLRAAASPTRTFHARWVAPICSS